MAAVTRVTGSIVMEQENKGLVSLLEIAIKIIASLAYASKFTITTHFVLHIDCDGESMRIRSHLRCKVGKAHPRSWVIWASKLGG